MARPLIVRILDVQPYTPVWQGMRDYTEQRTTADPDEIWLVEHLPVYTFGLSGHPEHLLQPAEIPIVHTDRGGQITYHGPGQLVFYPLLDLRRRGCGIRALIDALEQSVIALLGEYGIPSATRPGAPGVYVDGRKIASLGLRVRRGCSYHGLSLNVSVDLRPFLGINPCGYPGLQMTRLTDLGVTTQPMESAIPLLRHFLDRMAYTEVVRGDAPAFLTAG